MQDRSVGDVGDFFKLGVLRWLVASSPYAPPLRLGVIWFRVADEADQRDGGPVSYLDRSSAAGQVLRRLDADLYDRLGRVVAVGNRSIGALVSSGVLPPDTVTYDHELTFADLDPSDRARRVVRRERWFHDAMVSVDPCALVFVDPDNGLRNDGRAAPSYRDHAEKHAYLSEIGRLLERGHSVVVSHRADSSETVAAQAVAEMNEINEALGVEPLAVVRASRWTTRLLVVIPAVDHRSDLEARLGALQLSSWGDEVRLTRWRKAAVAV